MNNILFPTQFRIVGWVMFVLGLVVGIMVMSGVAGLSSNKAAHDAALIGIAVGALFIVCSREPDEDEMVKAIRLSSLLNALYANVIIMICSILILSGEKYVRFMEVNMVLIPIIYVTLFRAEIYRLNKMSEDEE